MNNLSCKTVVVRAVAVLIPWTASAQSDAFSLVHPFRGVVDTSNAGDGISFFRQPQVGGDSQLYGEAAAGGLYRGRICRHQSRLRAVCKCLLALSFLAAWTLLVCAAGAADVMYYELFKGQMFAQSGTNSPILATNGPYMFQVFVDPLGYPSYYSGYVSSPMIQTPAGVNHALTLNAQKIGGVFATNFMFMDAAATQSALDAAYDAGTYTLHYVGTHDGTSSIVLSLDADDFPPAAPCVSNLVAAQSINSSADFTLRFAAWVSAHTNDFVQLTILDSTSNVVFSTPSLLALYPQRPLAATNTSIVISNGMLAAGRNYTATLAFMAVKTNHLSALPYFAAGFCSQTAFTLGTQTPIQTNSLPPPASPASLTNTLLTLTITNGSGPFADTGAYQIFTDESATNYDVLGNAGGGFDTGGYLYAQTGTNTGTITFTDSTLGAVSMQVIFTSPGAGTFVLTNSNGVQAGVFTSAAAYPVVSAPNIFLPTVTNRQFQAFISGKPGVTYVVESSSNLVDWSALTNLNIPNLTTNIVVRGAGPARFYRVKSGPGAFAPETITGQSLSCSINAGAAPFPGNGIFQFVAGTNENAYQILARTGATNGSGSYAYTVTGPNTAAMSYEDSASGANYTEQLVFTSVAAGYFYTTNAATAGFQSGSFTLAAGPALFLGSVHFTPGTTRGASVYFPADGTPVSLSVTDAKGYVWSLTVPGDALLTPTTLSMIPAATVDTNQSVLPISSGVQLGPEGIQFCDGVTLTLTAPVALGAHATLLIGAGDGSRVKLVQTDTKANAYTTTLFHFSSGWISDPDAQEWQSVVNSIMSEAQADYNEGLSEVRALQKVVVQPPEPPDYVFKCSGNDNEDEAVDDYVSDLLDKEEAAGEKLLSAAKILDFIASDPSYRLNAVAAVEQLIETSEFRKINSLLSTYSGNPLKFQAVSAAALHVAQQDALIGGPGLPNLISQLVSWASGNVLSYYWDQLINQHDYNMAYALISVERVIQLLGGSGAGSSTFLKDMATGYTFDMTLTVNANTLGNSVQAHGTITLYASPDNTWVIGITPDGGIQFTNTFSYDSGTLSEGDSGTCTLELPLKFREGGYFKLDCDSTMVNIFILNAMGTTETWQCPDGSGPEQALIADFVSAYSAFFNSANNGTDAQYIFPVSWQNKDAQPVNATFPGGGGHTATLTIVVQHNTKSAPKKLKP